MKLEYGKIISEEHHIVDPDESANGLYYKNYKSLYDKDKLGIVYIPHYAMKPIECSNAFCYDNYYTYEVFIDIIKKHLDKYDIKAVPVS